ncbi:MAG: hypothetical protein ACRD80_08080 [Nitrososphaeraceae archaeon]|jgi:hypothetical protein
MELSTIRVEIFLFDDEKHKLQDLDELILPPSNLEENSYYVDQDNLDCASIT